MQDEPHCLLRLSHEVPHLKSSEPAPVLSLIHRTQLFWIETQGFVFNISSLSFKMCSGKAKRMEQNLKVQWILKDMFISLSYIRPMLNNPGWQNNSASHNCLGTWAFAPLSLWLFLEQIIIFISSLNLFGSRDWFCER